MKYLFTLSFLCFIFVQDALAQKGPFVEAQALIVAPIEEFNNAPLGLSIGVIGNVGYNVTDNYGFYTGASYLFITSAESIDMEVVDYYETSYLFGINGRRSFASLTNLMLEGSIGTSYSKVRINSTIDDVQNVDYQFGVHINAGMSYKVTSNTALVFKGKLKRTSYQWKSAHDELTKHSLSYMSIGMGLRLTF